MVLVGIPLFAFAFYGVAYLLPGPFGALQWFAAGVGGVVAWKVGVLVVERIAYTFIPAGGRDT